MQYTEIPLYGEENAMVAKSWWRATYMSPIPAKWVMHPRSEVQHPDWSNQGAGLSLSIRPNESIASPLHFNISSKYTYKKISLLLS